MISSEKQMNSAFSLMAPTSSMQAEFTHPAVAGGHAQFLTAWEHDRAGTAYQDIHARLATVLALHTVRKEVVATLDYLSQTENMIHKETRRDTKNKRSL